MLPGGELFKNIGRLGDVKFGDAMWNSAWIATFYTAAALLVCSMAGYAFAKYKFVLRDTIFFIFLASLMLPSIVTYVPLFKMISSWTWPTDLARFVVGSDFADDRQPLWYLFDASGDEPVPRRTVGRGPD